MNVPELERLESLRVEEEEDGEDFGSAVGGGMSVDAEATIGFDEELGAVVVVVS